MKDENVVVFLNKTFIIIFIFFFFSWSITEVSITSFQEKKLPLFWNVKEIEKCITSIKMFVSNYFAK